MRPVRLQNPSESFGLRPSVRRRLLRDRIEKVEGLPLDPYLQALLSFSLAGAAEALRTFQSALHELEDLEWEEFAYASGHSSQGYDLALGVTGWAYAARTIEVTWSNQYEDVLKLAITALPARAGPEARVAAYGRVGEVPPPGPAGPTDASPHASEPHAFQRTVLAAMYEAVLDRLPAYDAVTDALSLWLLAWTDGWAAFGQLQGQYSPHPLPSAVR